MSAKVGPVNNSLQELINTQIESGNLGEYKNELETMRKLQCMPQRKHCQKLSSNWMRSQERRNVSTKVEEMKQLSNWWREKGNAMIKDAVEKNHVGAIRMYTKAILMAPVEGDTLALAQANRAVPLQRFGYYAQAYDDCVLALQHGYPSHNRHKILLRQATSALKQKKIKLLQQHLDELEQMELNEISTSEMKTLRLAAESMSNEEPSDKTSGTKQIWLSNVQNIVQAPEPKGRHLLAKEHYVENELICTECAPSFVVIRGLGVCENCAASMIIPYPCNVCKNAIYCSLKCQRDHFACHEIECPGECFNLFAQIGISHLAFRTMTDGINQLLPLLQEDINLDHLWEQLVSGRTDISDGKYGLTLQMISHFDKMTPQQILMFARLAELLVIYLKEYTKFFPRISENVKCNMQQLELLVGALILRNIGQSMVNGFVSVSLGPFRKESLFGLLLDDLWSQPFHVKRGQLNEFSTYKEICAMNLPYLSFANNACDPSFVPRFSANSMSAYATRPIKSGKELTHAYVATYMESQQSDRRKKLAALFQFKCLCDKCDREFPDKEYNEVRQYRCEYDNCKKLFVPISDDPTVDIFCKYCEKRQTQDWVHMFYILLKKTENPSSRRRLYEHFKQLDRWVHGLNVTKLKLANSLVEEWFKVLKAENKFTNEDFEMLIDVIKYILDGTEKLNRLNSLPYVSKMLYLWDLIALGKYKCTESEMRQMLQAIEIISDEMKTICMNYYEDYIKPVVI